MVRILRQKQEKNYETGGAPVDLLLYFSKEFPGYLSDVEGDEPNSTDIDFAVQECKLSP
jgi:hypothetical protein